MGFANQFIEAEGLVLDRSRKTFGPILKKEYKVNQALGEVILTIYWKGESPKFRMAPTQRARLRAVTNNNFLSVQYL